MNQHIVNEPQAQAIANGARLLIVEIDDDIQSKMPATIGAVEMLVFIDIYMPFVEGDKVEINGQDFTIGEVSVKRVQDITENEAKLMSIRLIGGGAMGDTGDYNDSYWIIGDMVESADGMSWENEFFEEFEDALESWLKDQGIDYSANPWVALAELVKEIK